MDLNSSLWLHDPRLREERQYWENLWSELPERSLLLSASVKKSAVGQWSERILSLPEQATAWLFRVSNHSDRRLFAALAALTEVMLAKFTGDSRFLFAVPLERMPASDGLLNTFILMNMSAMSEQTYQSLTQAAHTAYQEGIKHCNFPLEAFLAHQYGEDALAFIKSCSIGIALNNIHDINNLTCKPLLQFLFERSGDRIQVKVMHHESLASSVVESLSQWLIQASLWISECPGMPIEAARLMQENERRRLLETGQGTTLAWDNTLTLDASFRRAAARYGPQTAAVCSGTSMTYEQLDHLSEQLAHQLIRQGLQPGEAAAIAADRSCETLVAMLAVLKAGAAYVPLDLELPGERLHYILQDSHARFVIAASRTQDLNNLGLPVIRAEHPPFDCSSPAPVQSEHDGRSLAYILYTSGSTGHPKGVMIEHRNVLHLVQALQTDVFQEELQERKLALVAPFFFDASVQQIYPALLSGATLYITPDEVRVDGRKLHAFYRKHAIEYTDGTPMHLKMLSLVEDDYNVLALKQLVIGGEALCFEDVRAFRSKFSRVPPTVTNVYGPTECCVDCSFFHIGTEDSSSGIVPIGRPLGEGNLYILRNESELVPSGCTGELWISGPGVGRGYMHPAAKGVGSFLEDPFRAGARMYRSGDLCRWDEHGILHFVERMDYQVKIKGYRIELGEIEKAMIQLRGLKEAVAVVSPDAYGIARLIAFYTEEAGKNLRKDPETDLWNQLKEHLPGYMIPASFIRLEELPLLSNGKINRRRLSEPEFTDLVQQGDHKLPQTPVEKGVHEIWCETLGVAQASVRSNFFASGGHSINAVSMASALQRRFALPVSVSTIFNHPSIEQLAGYIESSQATVIPIARYGERESYPLSFQQRPIFIQQMLYPASYQYNMPSVFSVNGKLDRQRLYNAFSGLVQRHDLLRASFHYVQGEPRMLISSTPAVPDLEDVGQGEISELLARFVRPFDLTKAVQMRMGIASDENENVLLLLDLHHLVCDGESMAYLLRDLFSLYAVAELPDLPGHRFADYCLWQEDYEETASYQQHEKHWREQFTGIGGTKMKYSGLDGDNNQPTGARVETMLDDHMLVQIQDAAQTLRLSVHVFMLNAYAILLSKYLSMSDFGLGTAVNARPAELSNVAGMFVYTLPLRIQIPSGQDFTGFSEQMMNQVARSLEHKEYRLEEYTRLIHTMFVYSENGLPEDTTLPDQVTLHPVPLAERAAKFDYTLECLGGTDGMCIGLDYQADQIEQPEASLLLKRYIFILEQVCANPALSLDEIRIRFPEEQAELKRTIERQSMIVSIPIDL
ncbi:amino acid adenylation domain-containing protein [Paenibacillus sp. FSL K6-1096]|uniref:non-ribosomal peptide synthetase n=1 Tax=Paenibacillus sp. FSL K6-1096 TaxID=2921460 RepID=UPI0030EEC497